jgi:MoCo/4Fe-4S cofactor protein with predicted Tat translocation signal
MSDKKYWQSFAELNDKEGFKRAEKDEFKEELPFEDLDGKGLLDAKTPRRDFLKYLGFSTAAATLAASCKMPVRKAIPYVNRPENITPGVPKYYASTYVQDGDVVPVVVKVRDGRPIKIEGNELSSLTLGGTNARAQASVLDLYDTFRLRFPQYKAQKDFTEIPTFEQLDQRMTSALGNLGGKPIVLLTTTIVSPTTKAAIAQFLGRYPGSRHVQYDPVSYSGILLANNRRIPEYRFDKAKLIVSLGADFLGTWLSPVEYARQYSFGRKMNDTSRTMNRHYQFESYLSMTGCCADERFTHRPSETGMVAAALLAAVGGGGTAPNIGDAKLRAAIQKVGNELRASRGSALVVCGSNDPNVQTVVAAINSAIGANGTTINTGSSLNTKQGIDTDMVALVNDMNAGNVGALLIYGANPAYEYYQADKFKAGLGKVRLTVSFNEKMDETTELCQYSIPTHHYLESWGDAEPRPGYISFIQPTIYPLFKTRPFQTSLLRWSGDQRDYETYFRQYWAGLLGGEPALDKALQDGLLERTPDKSLADRATAALAAGLHTDFRIPGAPADSTRTVPAGNVQGHATTATTVTTAAVADSLAPRPATPVTARPPITDTTTTNTANTGGTTPGGNLAAALAAINSGNKGGKTEIVLYQKVSIGTGKQAGNPWLQEVPDPVTKAAWDNYALISAKKADELGIDYKSSDYEYYMDKPVIELTANGKKISLPVFVIPGMHPDTIAVAVGYGRNAAFGTASAGVGQNIYPFARFNGTTFDYYNDVTTSERSTGSYKVAQVQIHNSYEGRTEVVKETTLATFLQHPDSYKEERKKLVTAYAPKTGDYRKESTLYGDHVQPGLKWGMSIDMNSCIGCQACVVACHIENNVPVVGKKEVLRYHDMHWLRIDRYFVTDKNDPSELQGVVFQPMLCQHCDNAPCENVCPVAATMHNSEGINQMAYNRCIGTRYCANNCPYKVRRFNWADYMGADSFADNQKPLVAAGKLDEVVLQMNDELTRMVLNPDVTVRSRGVMEKCTFCVQRTQAAKLNAKLENREFQDGDVQTACQQACPTDAIVFGNVNDNKSRVTSIRKENTQRLFYVIEQLHTLPNVNYLAKVRNSDIVVEMEDHGAGHRGQPGTDPNVPKQHTPAQSGEEGAH